MNGKDIKFSTHLKNAHYNQIGYDFLKKKLRKKIIENVKNKKLIN